MRTTIGLCFAWGKKKKGEKRKKFCHRNAYMPESKTDLEKGERFFENELTYMYA